MKKILSPRLVSSVDEVKEDESASLPPQDARESCPLSSLLYDCLDRSSELELDRGALDVGQQKFVDPSQQGEGFGYSL